MKKYLFNQAILLISQDKYDEAIQLFKAILEYEKKNYDALFFSGVCYGKIGKHKNAITFLKKAFNINPSYDCYLNLGKAFLEEKKFRDSISLISEGLRKFPNDYRLMLNIANAYLNLNENKTALQYYQKLIKIDPKNPIVWRCCATAYEEIKEFELAKKCYSNALEIDPENAEANYNLGLLYLALKEFEKGWPFYEKRWLVDQFDSPRLNTAKPRWNGVSSNKTVLLWSEQGLGDQILYGSMFGELEQFTNKFIISLDVRLIPIFTRSFSKIHFIDKEKTLSSELYDEQLPIGSLGSYLRTSIQSFHKSKNSYLILDKNRCQFYSKKFEEKNKIICGLSWRSQNKNFGHEKSIKLKDLLPILKIPNLLFVDLQYDDTEDERNLIKEKYGIDIIKIRDLNSYNDLDGLAALIQACNLVITISNINAHISGALGVKTKLLLPKARGRIWYWGQDEKQSIWYKNTKKFEQNTIGQWNDVVQAIVDDLSKP